jgi:uncharacterized lipoprotein YmbA
MSAVRRGSTMAPCVCAALALCLCACGSSPPTRYYTLEARPAPARSGAAEVPIRVAPVTIPAELDRQGLVTRIGPNQLRISDTDRWAAPLEGLIRRTLSADLAARLPAGMVLDPYAASGSESYRSLRVDFESLYSSSDCAVTLQARWQLQSPSAPVQHGHESVEVPSAGTCPGAQAAGISGALAELSDRIAAATAR